MFIYVEAIQRKFNNTMVDSISMLIWKKREEWLLIYLSMLYGPRLEFVRKAETVNARKHYTVHGYMIGIPNFLFISRSLFYLRMWYIEEDLVFRRVVHILSKALITNIIVGFINRYITTLYARKLPLQLMN